MTSAYYFVTVRMIATDGTLSNIRTIIIYGTSQQALHTSELLTFSNWCEGYLYKKMIFNCMMDMIV
jgi:hypothetical protein